MFVIQFTDEIYSAYACAQYDRFAKQVVGKKTFLFESLGTRSPRHLKRKRETEKDRERATCPLQSANW